MPDVVPFTPDTSATRPTRIPRDLQGTPCAQGTLIPDRDGSPTAILTIAAGNLASDYVAGSTSTEIDVRDAGRVVFWVEIAPGATAPSTLVFEYAARHTTGGSNYNEINQSDSGGTTTATLKQFSYTPANAVNVKLKIPLDVAGDNFGVFRVKGTGTLTDCAITVYATRAAEK